MSECNAEHGLSINNCCASWNARYHIYMRHRLCLWMNTCTHAPWAISERFCFANSASMNSTGWLWRRHQTQGDAPLAIQKCSDSHGVCFVPGDATAYAWEMLQHVPIHLQNHAFLECFRNNHQQNLQFYMLCAWAAVWTVSIVLAVSSRCSIVFSSAFKASSSTHHDC